MPLRDDHEAALARADALQVELDAQRAKDQIDAARVEELERELGDARVRLARAEAQLASLKPASREPATTSPAPARESRSGLVLGFAVVGLLIVGLVLVGARTGERHTPRRQRPAPPFGVEQLLADARSEVYGAPIRDIDIEYINDDGTLDPTSGRISVETTMAPAPDPPDDPARQTGAPSTSDVPMASCSSAHWDPLAGWVVTTTMCLLRGETPGGPACTPTAVIAAARADGAPRHALARIRLEWALDVHDHPLHRIWKWTYSIRDRDRGVSFSREYVERGPACTLAAPG